MKISQAFKEISEYLDALTTLGQAYHRLSGKEKAALRVVIGASIARMPDWLRGMIGECLFAKYSKSFEREQGTKEAK